MRPCLMLLALALLPVAGAHDPVGAPNPECSAGAPVHDYALPTSAVLLGFPIVGDGCADVWSDREPEWGLGGAFLHASHHDDAVCVWDEVHEDRVEYRVGADGNGDGVITSLLPDRLTPRVTGCTTAGFPAGTDGGWWVIVHAPASVGHVYG